MKRLFSITKATFSSNLRQSLFGHVDLAPKDPILWTREAFKRDESSNKLDLGAGIYRDNDGNPYVFNVVRRIQESIIKNDINHEYLDIDGLPEFIHGARNLLFGSDSQPVVNKRIVTTQSISGTGALSVGFDFIAKYLPRIVYISNPTWAIHRGIIEKVRLRCIEYPYYNPTLKGIDFNAMTNFLQSAVPGSFVLLHVCAHNPTGFDLSQDQWKTVASLMKKKDLIPFFDSAYQGFATGDLLRDSWPVKYFADLGFQMFVAQSFAKNMGLYGERVGALHVVVNNRQTAQRILSQIKIIIRGIYSSPSRYGARIAATILNNPTYFNEWNNQLRDVVAFRIKQTRQLLRQQLQRIGAAGTWHHITDQIGMFSYIGLNQKVCTILSDKYHVYLLKSGRMSMAGVNKKNVKYLSQSIKSAIIEAGQS